MIKNNRSEGTQPGLEAMYSFSSSAKAELMRTLHTLIFVLGEVTTSRPFKIWSDLLILRILVSKFISAIVSASNSPLHSPV